MITYVDGDLFKSPAQTLVNTVNTVGVMGKGIALTFKQLYPEMFAKYQVACQERRLAIGTLLLHRDTSKWVLNFPTKTDWRRPSSPEYIEAGLKRFRLDYDRMGIQSIAFPPLGCGNGELDFTSQVQPLMEKYLSDLPIDVFVYLPRGPVAVPEHKDIEAMRRWLRHSPDALPSSEVWSDLQEYFAETRRILTISRRSNIDVVYDAVRDALRVSETSRNRSLTLEDIDSVWQSVRGYGIATTRMASDQEKSRLVMSVLSELPYVVTVGVSETVDGLRSNAGRGIQWVPIEREKSPQRALAL